MLIFFINYINDNIDLKDKIERKKNIWDKIDKKLLKIKFKFDINVKKKLLKKSWVTGTAAALDVAIVIKRKRKLNYILPTWIDWDAERMGKDKL